MTGLDHADDQRQISSLNPWNHGHLSPYSRKKLKSKTDLNMLKYDKDHVGMIISKLKHVKSISRLTIVLETCPSPNEPATYHV